MHLFCEKNRKIRVDKTNQLWYSVLATRLDKSNHVAPEKRKPLQGLLRKPDPPWQSCGAVSGDPQVCRGEATPSCLRKTALWLKSPTGAFIAAQPRHSHFQRKRKIRTLLLSRKGSDFHCLVRIRGLEPPPSCPD